jgi:hypothetical protein
VHGCGGTWRRAQLSSQLWPVASWSMRRCQT